MKLCKGCEIEKPLDQFPNNKKGMGGKHSRCRACRAITAKVRRDRPEVKEVEEKRLREQYQRNRDELLAKRKVRYATTTKETELRRNKAWSDANRDRHRELNRQWSKTNPEAARALVARRRARIAGASGSYNKLDIAWLMFEQNGLCVSCRTPFVESGYHVDHIMPISKGGANSRENLQLLCPTCNRRKGAKHPDVWKHEVYL